MLLFVSVSGFSQNKWNVSRNYIQYDKKNIFLNGVNYVPPRQWMMMLENWDEAQVEKDIIGMKSLGVKCVRFFPLWHLAQPMSNQLDEKIMLHIDRVMVLGAKYGIYFQITPITGWMSGKTFLPEWALGNIFTDPEIIKGEKFLVREFAKRYKGNPAVQGFDFGNEINVLIDQMKLKLTPDDIDKWMQAIYGAFKEGDPDCIVTNGIGTGFDPYFNIEAISKSCDFMSVHSYPYFHGTSRLDPVIGERTMYSGNFITEWAAMMHKPVLLQENGSWEPGIECAEGLRIYYTSSWAEGATGYFWWGSHMVDPAYQIYTKGLRQEYSVGRNYSELGAEKRMGILSVDNIPEISGEAYKECTNWIDQLGVNWKDQLPVCYILIPHTTEFYNTMLRYITPFALAKQAHFDVKLLWEDRKVPEDASCIVISGFQLSEMGKQIVSTYLQNGGTVYQSYYNDLSSTIQITNKSDTTVDSLILFTPNLVEDNLNRNFIRINKANIREITFDDSKVIALNRPINGSKSDASRKNIFVKTKVGKGTFYFLAAGVEETLWQVRNPWSTDDSYKFYSALKPKTDFQVDNKYVEFYHKKRNKEELLVLINHENSIQKVTLHSNQSVKFENAINKENLGKGSDFCFQLKPADVLFIKVDRK